MFKILRGGSIYSPEEMGKKDILIAGEKIVNIAEKISPCECLGKVEVIDVEGKYIVPGFIDQHVHIIGGGGEGGYATRTPEVMLTDLTCAGITTIVGCLGTDGTTRHMTTLLAKARGLEIEGITAYIYTGCYQLPTRTITGSVRDDIVLIDKIIGAGEIAISDHRSSQPTKEELKKLAAEARVGGMLSGKAGVVHLHLGDGKEKLGMIFEVIEETEIPVTQFTPTHINRNIDLLEDGISFANMGGIIDITSSSVPSRKEEKSIKPSKAIKYCIEKGVSVENITMSSDGNGSLPVFDEKGDFIGLSVAKPYSLYKEFKDLVLEEGISLVNALKIITENPAKSLRLFPKKGTLVIGSDADIVVLDGDLNIEYVFAKGKCMIKNKEIIVKGTFE